MSPKINILAISGSTRKNSSNGNLIKAIAILTTDIYTIEIYEGIDKLPHFNPDLDYGQVEENPQVAELRRKISTADAILICSPEYALGVPGTLKNAIDWTVSTMNFSQKPVALITASTAGIRGHQSLLGTLLVIESKITTDTEVLISSIQTKVNSDFEITDQETLILINKLINSLTEMVKGNVPVETLLPAPLL